MPTFELSGPDGGTYHVDAPDETAALDAFHAMNGTTPAPSEGSSISGVAKSLGTGLAQGVIGLAGMPGDLLHLGTKLAGDNLTPESNYGSDAIQKAIEARTGEFHKPQGTAESIASKIGQFAPAVIGGPETLAAKVAQRVVAPAIASEAGGAVGGPLGEVAGALAGGVGATAAARKFQAMAATRTAANTVPTGEQLLETGSDQFNAARNMDVAVKPTFAANTARDMRDAVKDYDPEQIKPVLHAVDRMDELYKPTPPNLYNTLTPVTPTPPIDMNEVELIRKQLSGLRTSPDATLRTAAKSAREVITKNQMALTAADAARGDASLYSQTIKNAVGNYAAGKRSATVTGKADLAALNSGTAGSGANQDNNLRQAIKQLARPINNTNVPVARKLGFNDQEIAAIQNAATGTKVGNIARYIGKGAPTGLVSAAGGLGVGHMAGGPVGAVAVPVVGYIAKKIGDLSTKQAVAAIDSLVRSRSPLAVHVAAQLPPHIVAAMPAKSIRLLRAMTPIAPPLSQTQNQRQPVG